MRRKFSQTRITSILAAAALLCGLLLGPLGGATSAAYHPAADEAIVTSADALREALENGAISTIYFGADITLATQVKIAKREGGTLTICGTDPRTGERYEYSDHSASLRSQVPLQLVDAACGDTVVFRDIDLVVHNYYGVLQVESDRAENAALTVVFERVSGIGTQFVWLPYSRLVLRDSTLEVVYLGAMPAEEVAEVAEVRFEGGVALYQNMEGSANSAGYSFFNFLRDTDHTITLAPGAQVLAKTEYNLYGCFHFYYNLGGRASMTVGEGASFTFVGTDRFSAVDDHGRFDTVVLEEGAELTITAPESSLAGAFLYANEVRVGRDASLGVFVKNELYGALRTNLLRLEQPRRVVLYNAGGGSASTAVGSLMAVGLEAAGVESLRYFATADGYDFDALTYDDTREDAARVLYQQGGFDVRATRWSGAGTVLEATTYTGQPALTAALLSAAGMKAIQINGTPIPDGENPDGENPDGETPDGENPDGETPDGETPDGENPDGENPDGENPDGEIPDGETPDGENPDGEMPDEETPGSVEPESEEPGTEETGTGGNGGSGSASGGGSGSGGGTGGGGTGGSGSGGSSGGGSGNPPKLETDRHIVYLKGDEKGRANADADVTRAEVAMVLYRLIADPGKEVPIAPQFADVPAGAWYTQAVSYLAARRIVQGDERGLFDPHRPVTRAELVTLLTRFFETTASTHHFPDVAEDHWAAAAIASAVAMGWVKGYPDGTFRPEHGAARAEMVVILGGVLGRQMDASRVQTAENPFHDLEKTHWAYADILEAALPHEYTRDPEGGEVWTHP